MTLASLIERVEKAEAGSRELDAAVWAAANGYELFEHDGAGWRYRMSPDDIMRHERTGYISPYTTSLDAALALAERVLPNIGAWDVGHAYDAEPSHYARLVLVRDGDPEVFGRAPTPALALVLAVLRAKAGEA